jgi:hypothetical protein
MGKKRIKRTPAEKLLHDTRKNPSPTCNDPKQIDLLDIIQQANLTRVAFERLDEIISRKLAADDDGTA